MARVLVVDDEPGIRSLLKVAFQRAGHSVQAAGSAAEAMALCDAEPFDAVLSDVTMPEQTGHDLIRWLVTHHPAIRYMLMTAFNIECADCPITERCAVLRKPFQPKQAVEAVEALLDGP